MHHLSRILVLTSALALTAAVASAQNRPFEVPPARTAQAAGAALSLPSNASPRAIVAQYLRGRGHDQATAESVVEAGRNAGRQGITHVQFEQRAGGLAVYGTYVKAALSASGELVSVIENVAAVPGSIRPAGINGQRAIAAAVANLYPALRTVPPGFFRSAPSAARVAIPHEDGSMSTGFLVETWTDASNQLHYTLVDGDGAVLHVESRTQNDDYNVFRIHPGITPQTIVAGPGAGNAESPAGWLFATGQGTTSIGGNNAHAYLDVVNDGTSDALGTPVTSGQFVTGADLTVSPSTAQNREVAVQNLFFLNNVIHDVLYRHGFVESAGNFQEDNFGNGGLASDSVNAEAQDGGGTDNANFATPNDGSNPRMQMYLWTGDGPTHSVLAGGQTLGANGATFGPALDTTGVSSTIQLANDGAGTTSDACERLPRGSLDGAIALVDRGTCAFVDKVEHAQAAGAIAVIVANNTGTDEILVMGGSSRRVRIPAVLVSLNSGNLLKAMVPVSGVVKLADVQPLQRDGDIDADIVFHEYCHGLTWRMIGGMSGPLAGAVGEGMSDVCAMLLTAVDENGAAVPGADVVGEYSFSNPLGIRRQPYAGYDLITYGDIVGEEVHNDGEVYAAIGWRLLELFGVSRRDELLGYLVDGMNYTPSTPTFEEMRDGVLQSVSTTSPNAGADSCLVWQAFAQYGVGVNASAVVRGPKVVATESFDLPAACQP